MYVYAHACIHRYMSMPKYEKALSNTFLTLKFSSLKSDLCFFYYLHTYMYICRYIS